MDVISVYQHFERVSGFYIAGPIYLQPAGCKAAASQLNDGAPCASYGDGASLASP